MTTLIQVLIAPFTKLLEAWIKALLLFWPTMIAFGVVHSFFPIVPPFGWIETVWIITLITLLVPTSTVNHTHYAVNKSE